MLSTTRDDAAPPLLGRTEEQGLLASLLDEVATRGRALVLRGEPGIGKSRLLSETARSARERGMTVLTAAGVTQLAVARGVVCAMPRAAPRREAIRPACGV